jgi:hypothetical protein
MIIKYKNYPGQFEVFHAETKDARPMLQKWNGAGWYWWDIDYTGHPQHDCDGPWATEAAAADNADLPPEEAS